MITGIRIIPNSLAVSIITGVAPVPVPPPNPAMTTKISEFF